MCNVVLTDLNVVDDLFADGVNKVLDLAVVKRQTVAFLRDQAHHVELSTVVVALPLKFNARLTRK